MDKTQAIDAFFSSFGWPAFDENCVETENERFYITYEAATGSDGELILTNPALYGYTNSYEKLEKKAAEIYNRMITMRPPSIPIDGGRLVILPGSPEFSRRIDSGSAEWKKIVMQIYLAFLTN